MRACQSCQVFSPTGTSKNIETKGLNKNFSVSFKVVNLPTSSTPDTLKISSNSKISSEFEVVETNSTPLINDADIVVTFKAKKSKAITSSEFLASLFFCLVHKENDERNDFVLVESEPDSIILHLPDGTSKKYDYERHNLRADTSKAKLFLEEVLKLLAYPIELVIVTRSAEEAKLSIDTLFLALDKKRIQAMKIWFTVSKTFRNHQVNGTLEKLNDQGIDQFKELLLSDYLKHRIILTDSDVKFVEVDFRFLGNAEDITKCTHVLVQRLKSSRDDFEWFFSDKELNNDQAASEERYGLRKFLRYLEKQSTEYGNKPVLVTMKDLPMLEILMRKLSRSQIHFNLSFAQVEDKNDIKYPLRVYTMENYKRSSKSIGCLHHFNDYVYLWMFKSWSPEKSEKIALEKLQGYRHNTSTRESQRSRTKSSNHDKSLKRKSSSDIKSPPRKIPTDSKQDENANKAGNENDCMTEDANGKVESTTFEIKLKESAIFSEDVPTGPWKVHLPQGYTYQISQSPANIQDYGMIAQSIIGSNRDSEAFITVKRVLKTNFHLPGKVIGTAELTQQKEETCSRAFSFFCPVEETSIGSKRSKWVKMQAKSNVKRCEELCHACNVFSVNTALVPRLNNLSRYVMQNIMSIYVTNVSSEVHTLLPSQCIIKAVCQHGQYEESQCFSKK